MICAQPRRALECRPSLFMRGVPTRPADVGRRQFRPRTRISLTRARTRRCTRRRRRKKHASTRRRSKQDSRGSRDVHTVRTWTRKCDEIVRKAVESLRRRGESRETVPSEDSVGVSRYASCYFKGDSSEDLVGTQVE